MKTEAIILKDSYKMRRGFPQEILVYVCDKLEDGTLVYAVATNVSEIPEDNDGGKVGVYALNRVSAFHVHRELS